MNVMNEEILLLNEKLKNVQDFSGLERLEKEMNNYGKGFVFRMKKTHFQAYSFIDNGSGKVDYIVSDGVSRRLCSYNKLYIYMEISYSAR